MKSSADVEEAEVHSGNHALRKLWKPWKGMIIAKNYSRTLITAIKVLQSF